MINYVYYPCAGFDGTAVKIFGKIFQYYVYVDQIYDEKGITEKLDTSPFYGYRYSLIKGIGNDFYNSFHSIEGKVAFASFERIESKTDEYGPKQFFILFIRGDGIKKLEELINLSNNVPKAVIYIRPGISFGENRESYPNEFDELVYRYHNNIDYIAHDWGYEKDNILKIKQIYQYPIKEENCNTEMENELITIRGKKI